MKNVIAPTAERKSNSIVLIRSYKPVERPQRHSNGLGVYNLYPSTKTLGNGAYFECRVVVSKMETTTEKTWQLKIKKPCRQFQYRQGKNKKGYKKIIDDIVIVSHKFE